MLSPQAEIQFECPPILFLIFNRPDLTKRVFERIREARPGQLFIAADGPRADRPGEADFCVQTRSVVETIDWDCEVHRLFCDHNLGCKMAVSSAITWFFAHVEEGIILEDDCLPHPSFFRFCRELLERYRDNERVVAISGNNFQPANKNSRYSYYFSIYNHIWGWASWRRAWQHYDGDLKRWPQLREEQWLSKLFRRPEAVRYWSAIFDQVYEKRIDSWGYPWTYSCWIQNGLTVLPSVNLVTNLGFDERATHTKHKDAQSANLPVQAMPFPLIYPPKVVRNFQADENTSRYIFGIRPSMPAWYRVVHRIRRILEKPALLME